MNLEYLGIVVIGRNEGQRLIDCLTSLRSFRNEIVYVDSGSTDGSVLTAERLGAFVIKLDRKQPFTAARARNEGFAAVLSRWPNVRFVNFIDGDCELVPSWLASALVFVAERKDIAIVCGRRRENYPESSIYNWLCDIEWNTPVGEALACGGDFLVRVAAFEAVGGFRPNLIAGEEPDLCVRLRQKGWRVWRIDAEMTRHNAAMSRFNQWWHRAVRSGYGEAEIAWHYSMHFAAGAQKKAVARSILWGGLVPLLIVLGALFHSIDLLGFLIYPLQVARIALRRGATAPDSWLYGLFMMIAKFAQLQGNLKYIWQRLLNGHVKLIEYKQQN